MRNTLPDRVRLGVFEVDLRIGEVRQEECSVILPDQALCVLRMLIERNGELVDREEIRRALWPNDTVVEFDHSINTSIRNLRRILGDSPDQPRYIQTIPRRGYRLLLQAEPIQLESDSSESAAAAVVQTLGASASSADTESYQVRANGNLIGKKVSHYRVLNVLGGGGMGMLYKAEDLKLGRQVALKFLPEELAWDTVALQRFEREARTASSLDHPNICTIYEVEEHEGEPFIVMQLLQGETLRDRLVALAAQQKKMPLRELLEIAIQICEGLQAAHTKDIIHRDIKPANIFLTSSGQVKILDFGLAKLVSVAQEDGSDGLELGFGGTAAASTPSRPAFPDATLTRLGVAIGTAGYMSPEQVRGEKLDARTDIFSFGLVLYEMSTGQRAFAGETAAIVHSAIVNDPPGPPRQVNPEIPLGLEAVINKSLEKAREQRYQTAAQLGQELRGLQHEASERPAATKYRRLAWLAALLLIAFGVLAVVWLIWRGHGAGPVAKEQQLTANPPDTPILDGAISPDGRYVAYEDRTGLYVRTIASGEVRAITLTTTPPGGFNRLQWFPAGTKLLASGSMSTGGAIYAIDVLDKATPHLLYKGTDAAISPDGRKIAFITGNYSDLWVGDVNGDTPRRFLTVDATSLLSYPAWSPDSRWVAYGRTWRTPQGFISAALEMRRPDGGAVRTIVAERDLPDAKPFVSLLGVFSQAWLPDWSLVFTNCRVDIPHADCSLWRVPVDPSRAEVAERPKQLTSWGKSAMANLTASTDGKRLAAVKIANWRDVYVGELNGQADSLNSVRRLTLDQRGSQLDDWTHDSLGIFFTSERNGRSEIFRQAIGSNIAEVVVTGTDNVCAARVSPDGSSLFYLQSHVGTPCWEATGSVSVMHRAMDSSSAEKLFEVPRAQLDNLWCSSNPKAAVPCVVGLVEAGVLAFYALDPANGKGRQLGRTEAEDETWHVSRDGSSLALLDPMKYPGRIRVLSLGDGTWRDITFEPKGFPVWVSWAADGQSLFVSALQDSWELQHVTMDGKVQFLFHPRGELELPLASPNGGYLAFQTLNYDGNVWLLENL